MNPKFEPVLPEDADAFYEGKRTARLLFAYNDHVLIKEGERKGQLGWIVSLVESMPEPRYTVELCSGQGDLYLRTSEIELSAE
ncbi:MAG TPA: hypothetical protein VK178_10640 [Opitutaceae bacterium]|nr:hypothetical protein [Opitutaceae bacterium]HLP69837.1 hypothetical protein [Rhizobium sp.]